MLNWHIVQTKQEFLAGTPLDTDLYFIADSGEIYRGSASYSQSVRTFTTGNEPANPAVNVLYINTDDLSGKIYNGTTWSDVIRPTVSVVTESGENPVNSTAVIAYVAQEIAKITGEGSSVVTNITWDDANQILDIFKGSAKQSITLSGLGVDLSLSGGKLQLKDTEGNLIGTEVSLDTERFVTGGEYVASTKTIVLYFDGKTGAESTDKIEIPVTDLVDTYTAGNTSSINMSVSSNQFTATVRISVEGGNALELKDDGLFVSVPDITNKINKVSGATAGNLPMLTADGSLEDSGIAATSLQGAQIFTGTTTPEQAVGGSTPKKNDICIITKKIGETDKSEITGYIYNGSAWVAMDGNYSAENVYFPEDLTTTFAMGNFTLQNGQATIPAAGKNLKQVWDAIYVQEKNPTITQPSVSVSCPQAGRYEVGTSVTPTYTATLNAGSYQYGPATGITATAWNVQDSDSHALTTNSGSFDAFTVEDSTNYTISATATYNAGAMPVTNVGNEYAAGQIKAGSKTGTSSAITGYRAGFYGTLTSKDGEINSALVRSLPTKTNAAPTQGTTWNLSIHVGALRVVFAYPATIRDVNSVTDVNGMGAEVKTAFTKYEVQVDGNNSYTAAAYKVYVMDLASPNDTANTYKITL